MRKSLGLFVLVVASSAWACDQPQARAKVPFPLKAVVLDGQDHQFVEDAITARFLEDGAIAKIDGVEINGNVEWTTDADNQVIGIKLNLRAIRPDGLSVASAIKFDRSDLARQSIGGTMGQGLAVRLAARAAVADFRRQVLQQQDYLPKGAEEKKPLH